MHPPTTSILNPLLRTPISLLVDDSCPVINLTYYWIRQRHAWKARFEPDMPLKPGDGDPERLHLVPQTIPADFARQWGEWCAHEGVKGKFSMVPFPAGIARIDQGFPNFSQAEFNGWMRVTHEIIHPNFDITCEMMTHSLVMDLESWQMTDSWEQFEWTNPPVDQLAGYTAASMQVLKDAGLPCEGFTSPGAFGIHQEEAYARAMLDASIQVYDNPRPFYLLHVNAPPDEWPDVPIWHANKERGEAIASIVGCTGDWFGNWTGYDEGDPDRFISADLQGGILPMVLDRELPCVLVSHWPGMYFGGKAVGFEVLKEVKRRLDLYDPDKSKTRWMKFSEIGHYWMARKLSDITTVSQSDQEIQIQIDTRFPTRNFTLSIDTIASRIQVNGVDLQPVDSRASFEEGTYLTEGSQTFLAFELVEGQTTINLHR
ncbi:MAG: hypothetical protein AAF702_51895 [Chloroflexota bacterium]